MVLEDISVYGRNRRRRYAIKGFS